MSKFKISKLIFILFSIILLFSTSFCYAVDLNIVDDLTTDFSSNETTTTNTATNTDTTSSDSNSSLSDTSTNNSTSTNDYSYTSSNNTSTPSATITNTLPESSLGLNNILNILLIVIGTLIILLAIAILIRLKR